MRNKKHPPADVPYRAFLVRCWQNGNTIPETPKEAAAEQTGWSFVVVPVHNTTRAQGCNSLQELTAFLLAELAAAPQAVDSSDD